MVSKASVFQVNAGAEQVGTQVTIKNKLSVAVDIYDVFNPARDKEVVAYQYTKLATIAAGATVEVTTTRTVSLLEAMYTGTVKELFDNYYYQFPIRFMSGTHFSSDSSPPLSYTIEESDRTSMIQSFLFHKYVTANPGSVLAKNLNKALEKGDEKSINDFFASTKNFKQCTESSWNAIMVWLHMFTSPWQGPYYLYETAPSPLPQGYMPVLVATLNIKSSAKENSAVLAPCTQDADGNPVYDKSTKNTDVVMAGDGTMVDANEGLDIPVSLTPVWMNVIQVTMQGGKPKSDYIAGPVVTGTIAGKSVVSSQTIRSVPQKKSEGKQKVTGDFIFGKICQTVGLIVGIVMLWDIASKKFSGRQEAREEARSEADSEEDLQNRWDDIDDRFDSELSSEYSESEASLDYSWNGEDMHSSFDEISSQSSDSYSDISESMQEDVMLDTMDGQMDSINEEMSDLLNDGYTPDQGFEQAASDMEQSFEKAQSEIESGNFSDASSTLSEASSSMQETLQNDAADWHQSEVDALQNSSEAVEEAAQQSSELNEAQDKYEEGLEDESSDGGFEEETSEPEVDPIEEL